MLPESSSQPLTAILTQSRNLAHASLESAVDVLSVKAKMVGLESEYAMVKCLLVASLSTTK